MSSTDITIPFPLSSAPGARPQEGTGRLINCFAEARGDRAPMWRRAPGLTNFGTTSREGCRGLIEINEILYSAWGGVSGQLERHDTAGGVSIGVGALAGTRKGFFARNNKPPELGGPDQWFVDPDGNQRQHGQGGHLPRKRSGFLMFATPGSRIGRKTTSRLRQGYVAEQMPPRTVSSGTFRPDPRTRNIQYVINGGAFTFDPPAEWCTVIIDVLNNASAGAVTTSNWTKVQGDALDTTNGRGWRGAGSIGPLGSYLVWTRLI